VKRSRSDELAEEIEGMEIDLQYLREQYESALEAEAAAPPRAVLLAVYGAPYNWPCEPAGAAA